jgi:hypothetical protein
MKVHTVAQGMAINNKALSGAYILLASPFRGLFFLPSRAVAPRYSLHSLRKFATILIGLICLHPIPLICFVTPNHSRQYRLPRHP